jgi:hypothetical protein
MGMRSTRRGAIGWEEGMYHRIGQAGSDLDS